MRPFSIASLVVVFALQPIQAAEKTAADFLPSTVVVYAELPQPKLILRGVLNHPLRKKIEALDQYKNLLALPNYRQFITVTKFVEAQLGMKWQAAVEKLAGGGIYAGLDAATNGFVVLMKATDKESLDKIKDTLLRLARSRNAKAIPEKKYRGITAYGLDKTILATVDQWAILVTKNDFAKKILDLYKDDGGKRLSGHPRYKQARATIKDKPTLWTYVDLEALRKAGVAKELFKGKSDNAGVEVLVGGVLSTLKKTPFATSSFYYSTNGLKLNFSVPHQAKWVSEARDYFFGKNGKGQAPTVLAAKNTLLSISAYRNFSKMWLSASDLFDKQTSEELAKADSTLTTLLSGRDFGEDILGAFHPDMQLIFTRQDFSKAEIKPAIKLPAGALVMRLKNAKKNTGELRRVFQSLIGFINITGGMQGQPQLDLDIEKKDGIQLVSATYVPEDNENKKKARINFNFSPSIAFAGERVVLASTKQLARELALAKTPATPTGKVVNVETVAYLKAVKDILNDNRGQLIAQTMLSEGKNRKEAAAQIDVLLSVVGIFKNASMQLFTSKKTLQLQFQVRLAE